MRKGGGEVKWDGRGLSGRNRYVRIGLRGRFEWTDPIT